MYRSITFDDHKEVIIDKKELEELRRKAAKWDDLARAISHMRNEDESQSIN